MTFLRNLCAVAISLCLIWSSADAGLLHDFVERLHKYNAAQLHTLAETGDDWAQYELGLRYFRGQGVQRDYSKAVYWFEKAANAGNFKALTNLGVMYVSGEGVSQNFAKARTLFRKSADQGDALAQFNLGLMYAVGDGVTVDYQKAAKWYRKAAGQGYSQAQLSLGLMYRHGRGYRKTPGNQLNGCVEQRRAV